MKWGVFDSDNTFHCWMADTEKAIAHSISNIPRGAGQRQEHPFEATKYDDWLYSTMRPDISATVSKPQVHLRRPRAR